MVFEEGKAVKLAEWKDGMRYWWRLEATKTERTFWTDSSGERDEYRVWECALYRDDVEVSFGLLELLEGRVPGVRDCMGDFLRQLAEISMGMASEHERLKGGE